MNTFLTLTPLLRGLVLLWNVLLLLTMTYATARSIRQKRRTLHIRIQAVIFLGTLLLFAFLIHLNQGESSALAGPPLWAIPALLCALSLLCLVQMTVAMKSDRRAIGSASISEAIDRLPAGICCYFPGGLCKLVNEKMDWVCRELTGKGLRDGEAFWEILATGSFPHGKPVQVGDYPIVAMPGGSVVYFNKEEIRFDGVTMFEITAADVTEEYELTLEMEQKEKALHELNIRLKKLGEKISALTIEKEILNSKIRLHDSWSQTLLTTKKYLNNPTDKNEQVMYRLWDQNMLRLAEDHAVSPRDIYGEVFHNAQALGIQVHVTGPLPKEARESHIVCQALTTALGNLVRHAQGTELYVRSTRAGGRYVIALTNNGNLPQGPIRESGGLSSLRRLVEAGGGKMEVFDRPRFELRIEVGEEEYGI